MNNEFFDESTGVLYVYSNEHAKRPVCEHFLNVIVCSKCQKKYSNEFVRDLEIGIPLYYKRDNNHPLNSAELLDLVTGKLQIDWFCSPICASATD
jgi:hypothetical protein